MSKLLGLVWWSRYVRVISIQRSNMIFTLTYKGQFWYLHWTK